MMSAEGINVPINISYYHYTESPTITDKHQQFIQNAIRDGAEVIIRDQLGVELTMNLSNMTLEVSENTAIKANIEAVGPIKISTPMGVELK